VTRTVKRTIISEAQTHHIEPLNTPEAVSFYQRHIIDPAIEELRAGVSLPHILVLSYCVGLWHGMQVPEREEE
jgi:hypothetical protein